MTIKPESLKDLLEERVARYNRPSFIASDPICIPHQYSTRQDIEITAFWTAILAWGQRTTIIAKARDLFARMGPSPYEFIVNHRERDRRRFEDFRHRTFQPTDTLYFLAFLQDFYRRHASLETAFTDHAGQGPDTIFTALTNFHETFFAPDWAPRRTRKHVSTPVRGASCKRLNMFLRWMVRRDNQGVDFGLWRRIDPAVLMIPLDVHVHRVALRLGLLHRTQADWKSVELLTAVLREMDPADPARYDFALFGMGVLEQPPLP
ncbi:MAG: TIGR02757 family protein [Saprospiraceae bacterium]|nr:TIGR02757 family protein [Saprospiraceae bacterium]